MKYFVSVAGTSHAEVFPGGPRYDGVITIVGLTGGACSTLSDLPGNRYISVFRSKGTSSAPEAMSIGLPRGTIYIAAGFDGTFAGRRQVVYGRFIIDAYADGLPDARFHLKFLPRKITEATQSFTFDGTWKNYRVLNCVATVHGEFTKRPPG